MWFKAKPSVSNLRIFGSTCYVHIPKDQRSKWEMNSVKMMMVGCSDGNKAYRVYDSTTKKCYVRRDVKFDERSNGNEVIVTNNGEKDRLDNIEEKDATQKTDEVSGEPNNKRNPIASIDREPYPLRTRMPSISDTQSN